MTARLAMRRTLVAAGLLLAVLLACGAAAGLWLRGRMAASMPRLDGTVALPGLSAPVRVTRDALGVPTVTGSNRLDVARATGWLHAQDRFFQMDVLRRRGAGELSELFGKAALPLDREARLHGFRQLAAEVVTQASPAHLALVEAYAQGVNAGLAALGSKPWEYVVLRAEPRPWLPEDSALITYAMTLELQEGTGRYVRTLSAIRDNLGPASLAFFAPLSAPGDAALDASSSPEAPIPPASEVNLRAAAPGVGAGMASAAAFGGIPWEDRGMPGSNNFAVSGAVAGGFAIVANDMHLHLGVPNTWYRMSLRWPGHEETGVTLPGAPAIVAGSTGRIAWGYTNSNGGSGDIVVVGPSISPDLYHGPPGSGLLPFERRTETVAVKGSKPVPMEFTRTIWGPVVGEGPDGRSLAFHWTEDDPAATNFNIFDLEDAPDVRAAVAVAHRMGIPAQNFVVADSAGQIAWTIAGRLPKRVGYDGRLPVTWTFGDRRWDGYLPPGEVPTIVSPAGGRLWTANNRTVGGASLAALGDSGYDIAARARQIRDDLDALIARGAPLAPRDLLAIQLDDRAILMETWHTLLLETLRPDIVARKPSRARLLQAVQKWEGRASRLGQLPDRPRVPGLGRPPRVRPGVRAVRREGRGFRVAAAELRGAPRGDHQGKARPSPGPGLRLVGRPAGRRRGRCVRILCKAGRRPADRHVGPAQHGADRAPVCRQPSPMGGVLAQHARRPAARGFAHAARAGALGRGERALRRLAGTRGGGDFRDAGWPERKPALAVFHGGARVLGPGRPHPVPARARAAHARAAPVTPG